MEKHLKRTHILLHETLAKLKTVENLLDAEDSTSSGDTAGIADKYPLIGTLRAHQQLLEQQQQRSPPPHARTIRLTELSARQKSSTSLTVGSVIAPISNMSVPDDHMSVSSAVSTTTAADELKRIIIKNKSDV